MTRQEKINKLKCSGSDKVYYCWKSLIIRTTVAIMLMVPLLLWDNWLNKTDLGNTAEQYLKEAISDNQLVDDLEIYAAEFISGLISDTDWV